MAGKLSLRIQQLDVRCETKSKDNGATRWRVVGLGHSCDQAVDASQHPLTPPQTLMVAVFVDIVVSVQYQVVRENVYDAFYKLTDSKSQIRSYGGCLEPDAS